MKKQKICQECKENIAVGWIQKKNVCDRCFRKLKRNGNRITRKKTKETAWWEFLEENMIKEETGEKTR
jgi:predicted amidophosphoribosyltransferase